jgi:restriction system protein
MSIEEGAKMEFLQNYYSDNYDTFDQWLKLVEHDEQIYPRFRIPYHEWLEEYIHTIENRSEEEVKDLLRYLLFPYTRNLDIEEYEGLYSFLKNPENLNNLDEKSKSCYESLLHLEKYKRMENNQNAWEGLTWVLQLLPYSPYKAIRALNSYLNAEIGCLPDDRIIGIGQCISIIEARFIYTNKGMENVILRLKPREFERLIEILYQHIGYDTKLTPATRDGGKDIVANINREDGREIVYVECKLYKTTELTIETVRAFGYSVIKDNINRGVLFCTGYVNDRLKELDSRIQIWALEDIIILINAHIGADWEKRLDILIGNKRKK